MRARGRMVRVALAGSLVVTAACSGDGDGDGGADSVLLPGGGGDIVDHLASLPARAPAPAEGEEGDEVGETSLVVYGDLAAAADIAGIERPDDLRDGTAVDRYVLSVTGIMTEAGAPPAGRVATAIPEMTQATGRDELDDFAADVGWSILDVDRFVERRSPPDDALVLEGRFDADRIDEAMGERDGGVWQVGDPDGELDLGEQTPARRTGEPLWQSLDGDRLVVTGSAEGMEAARRGGSTLADDPILRPLAQALDGEGVYTAMLFGSPLPAPVEVLTDGEATRERIEEACAHALAETPAGVATGVTHDGGPVVVIALLHAGEAAAQANAEALPRLVEEGRSFVSEQTWRELFTVDRVTVEGTTTVARLRLREDANLRAWQTVIETRDSLVSAC